MSADKIKRLRKLIRDAEASYEKAWQNGIHPDQAKLHLRAAARLRQLKLQLGQAATQNRQ